MTIRDDTAFGAPDRRDPEPDVPSDALDALLSAGPGPLPQLGQRGPLPRDDSVNTLLSALLHAPGPSPPPPACVRGVDGAGAAHEVAVTSETETVALSGLGLRTASLVALAVSSADALRELSLAANALASLDLAPLASCPRLTVLAVNSNGLRNIDLRPLASCPALERLWLHDNKLEQLDLSPLKSATALRSLYLDDNRLHSHTLDLAPLGCCTQLRALRLAGNRLNGHLDITALLADPALSQLATDPTVRLIASGASSQARVSPALRRRVLDISFTPVLAPPCVSKRSPSPLLSSSSPTLATALPPVAHLSPSLSRQQSANETRTITPPSFGAPSMPPASRAAMPRTPPPERAAPVVAAVLIGFRRLARYSAEDALVRCGKISLTAVEAATAASAPSTLLDSHLALLHAPQAATLRKVTAAAKAHIPVVVFGTERYRSSNATLLKETLLDSSHFCADPLSDSDASLVFDLGLACARRRLGGEGQTPVTGSPVPAAGGSLSRKRPSLRKSRSVDDSSTVGGDSSASNGGDLASLSSPSSSGSENEEGVDNVRRRRRIGGSVEFNGSEDGEGGSPRSFWSEVSTRLKLFRRPPYSSPRMRLSRSPSLPVLQLDATYNGLPLLDRPFSPVVSSSTALSLACPEMRMHSANKTRAERAALEVVFHDLGGDGTVENFAGIARTCGLPKCAGHLLFHAALSALQLVEQTSPETGVSTASSEVYNSGEEGPAPPSRVSSSLFMQYWETRLHHYSADMRLYNVMSDSRMTRREGRDTCDRHEQDIHKKRQRTTSSLSSSTVSTNNDSPSVRGSDTALRPVGVDTDGDDLYRQCSSGSTSSSCSADASPGGKFSSPRRGGKSDDGCDGTTGLEGCDAGVGKLVQAFMYGRRGRFGMFALVKPSEAVAIGTALVLMGLRGECGSRGGGFARPVGAHEVCRGKLNAALISAESGIFQGVAVCLSMDKLRNIKGTFASEAAPESVVAADACALNYVLSMSEVAHYHAQRKLLMPRGVEALMNVHCHGRKHMTLTEFAVMHTLSNMIESTAAADYFFSAMDADQDGKISLADVQHFHSEKRRLLLVDQMALAGLHEVWACLVDNVRPANAASGIKRSEFLRLSGSDRKTAIESLLFRDDRHATLNIRATVLLEGGDPSSFSSS